MKSKFKNITFSKFVLWLLLFVMLGSFFTIKRWGDAEKTQKLIDWDVTSYYSYLPALFIHKDVSLEFTKRGTDMSYENNHQFWYLTAPNGKRIIKVTMGMAIMYSPFFFIGHTSAHLFCYETNGFSTPYEFCLALSSLFYLFIGLIFLRKSLLLFFNDLSTGITLLCVLLGTNLYYYTTTEPAMSHAYSFALISVFVFQTIKWHNSPSIKRAFLVGILFGLIVLVRPVNIIIILFPLLYNVYSFQSFKTKLSFFIHHKKHIFIIALISFLILLPQLIYWKYLTGQWLFNSYEDERFFFNNPHVLSGLFSFRNGWLIYSPIMVFSIIGIAFLYKKHKPIFLPILLFTIINLFICFSWWTWWYGGSFGSRPMIDSYALMAIPMALLIDTFFSRFKIIFTSFCFVILLFISLNLFQTYQRRIGLIHFDGMTFKAYKVIFLKTSLTKEEMLELSNSVHSPDYELARKGIEQ